MTDKEFFKRLALQYLLSKTKPEDYYYIDEDDDEDDDESELDNFFDMIFRIYVGVILLLLWILFLLCWW